MTATVLTAGTQIPADPAAPIRFDFELHALGMALVGAHVNRLNHRRKPKLSWWRAVAVVRDTTSGFDSAQIGYLEGRLAQELRARPGVTVREGVETIDVTLPTFARSPLDDFVGTILEALRVAGVDTQSAADEGPETEQVGSGKAHTVIPGTVKDLLAAGLLQAGSHLTAEREVGGKPMKLHAEVSASGELIFDGVAYRNPTRPAIVGFDLKSTNGWTAWKTSDGRTLADLRAELP